MTTETEVEVPVVLTPEQQEQAAVEADAAMEAGFKAVRGEAPAVLEEPATEPAKPDAAPKADAKGGPPAVKPDAAPAPPAEDPNAAWRTAQDQRMRSIEAHMGGLGSQLKDALKAVAKSGTPAPSGEQITGAPVGSAKWNQLKTDFPEWGEAVEEFFATQSAALKKAPVVDTDGMRKEFSNALKVTKDEARDEARQLARLDIKHEDWEQTLKSPAFEVWGFDGGPSAEERTKFYGLVKAAPQQAAVLQHEFTKKYPQWWADRGALMDSTNASDAIKLLDAFKNHLATAAEAVAKGQKQTSRLAAAAPLKGASVGGPRLLNDEEGLEIGFNKIRPRKQA